MQYFVIRNTVFIHPDCDFMVYNINADQNFRLNCKQIKKGGNQVNKTFVKIVRQSTKYNPKKQEKKNEKQIEKIRSFTLPWQSKGAVLLYSY